MRGINRARRTHAWFIRMKNYRRVARELTAIVARRGKPVLTSRPTVARAHLGCQLTWIEDTNIDGLFITLGKQRPKGLIKSLNEPDRP